MDGTVEDWATESLLAAREAYQDRATGMRIKPGAKLGREYFDKSLPVVKERMYRAGLRLARVLNDCFEWYRRPATRQKQAVYEPC